MSTTRRLVIASSLTELHNERLAALETQPKVIPLAVPWEVPAEADALFTYQTQWRNSPSERPAGWPRGLRWIQVASAGLDAFPAWFFEGPPVSRGRGVQAPAMAEYVLSAIMAHEKRFWGGSVHSRADWRPRELGGIAGKTVGIAGYGAIGEEIAKRALPLELKLKVLTRSRRLGAAGIEQVSSLSELFAGSDHLVLALPLTPDTRGSVNEAVISRARPGLHLLNVARGALIDEAALLSGLDTGQIAAATLDVTSPEPLPEGHAFYTHPSIRLTPHISGQSEDMEERLSALLRGNLDRFLSGRPLIGLVDPLYRY